MDEWKDSSLIWSISEAWNGALTGIKEKPLTPRDHIWASELGLDLVSRVLKMRAVPPSNPFTDRAKRKMEVGTFFEFLMERVLVRAGLLIENQEWLAFQYPGLLRVTGKLDFFAGGNPDYEKAIQSVDKMRLPDFFKRGADAIILSLRDKYPNGLEKIVIEIKSCSGYMFEKYNSFGPSNLHMLQTYHYLVAKNISEGHLLYIDRDSLRMAEFGIRLNSKKLADMYKADIESVTKHIKNNTTPEKEKLINFNELSGLFETNFRISYSSYLTLIYGFADAAEYDGKYKPMAQRFNRVLKRIAKNEKMTKKNDEIITEMKAHLNSGYDSTIEIAKTKLADAPEEVEDNGND